MGEKLHIEKNAVQETLVIPLYARKKCTELFPTLYRDETAARLIECIDYDFSANEAKARSLMQRFGFLEVAARQNLGCGLDSTGRACDNGACLIYNLDFPDVIEVRERLLPAGERERNIACDLNDTSWFSEIDDSGGAVFFASGVFYYFLVEQVRTLACAMAERFAGGKLVFDAANRMAVKMITKTWLKEAKVKDVGAYFAVSDAAAELSDWSERIVASSRGHMLGYSNLKDPSVSGLFRLLARMGDSAMKMQIVRLEFTS